MNSLDSLAIELSLPGWLRALDLSAHHQSDEAKMQLAIELARQNIENGGGPFGAVIFDSQTGGVLAPGVNLVMREGCSVFHAEVVAIMFAQKRLGSYTLSANQYELVTSSEPCAQCLGAVCWSGVTRLVCGARVGDAEALGFDEGPLAPNWQAELERRGIRVVTNILSAEAVAVLAGYSARGGHVYNGRTNGK